MVLPLIMKIENNFKSDKNAKICSIVLISQSSKKRVFKIPDKHLRLKIFLVFS